MSRSVAIYVHRVRSASYVFRRVPFFVFMARIERTT